MQALRHSIRKQRQALSPQFQIEASQLIAQKILSSDIFLKSQYIAAYLPTEGEVDPSPIIQAIWSCGKKCYLPYLHPLKKKELWFLEYQLEDPLILNRFGIKEPLFKADRLIPAWALHLVLQPLVAVDNQGNRLGRGGGFYDRSFAFLKTEICGRGPNLVGLAYEFQRVSQLKPQSWDLGLKAVATEKNYINFKE